MDSAKSEQANKNDDDTNEDKYRIGASMAFMIVVIVIGLPMWWKTTEVHRVGLPSVDIMSLSNTPTNIAIKIAIFTFQTNHSNILINELNAIYANNELYQITFEQILPFDLANNAKTPSGLELLILKNYELDTGNIIFIEWPKLEEDVLMSTERSAFIRADTSSHKINSVIDRLILQTHRIQEIITPNHMYARKSEAPQTEYDIVVTVLNPTPDTMDAKWNVRMAVETYIAPFLKEVSHVSNYSVKTQWKYQLPFEAELKQVRDATKIGRHYALPQSSLPHIITSIEKNLGVGITDKSVINLVVYITPCDIAPVHIYDHNNNQATRFNADSFISPKWGGIIIANPPMDACLAYNESGDRISFYMNTNDVMQIMLYQLHKLLDISVELDIDRVKTVALEQIAPRRWEYESYIRRSTVMHIATATNTLQSLIKLLDNISYIVINDEVSAAINVAYQNILRAKRALKQNQLLEASQYAKRAFIASEQAFFDASLLAQLYFPDEQKYAIYIPLFLPIMVPVISSFPTLRKLLKKLRNGSKEKIQ